MCLKKIARNDKILIPYKRRAFFKTHMPCQPDSNTIKRGAVKKRGVVKGEKKRNILYPYLWFETGKKIAKSLDSRAVN